MKNTPLIFNFVIKNNEDLFNLDKLQIKFRQNNIENNNPVPVFYIHLEELYQDNTFTIRTSA